MHKLDLLRKGIFSRGSFLREIRDIGSSYIPNHGEEVGYFERITGLFAFKRLSAYHVKLQIKHRVLQIFLIVHHA